MVRLSDRSGIEFRPDGTIVRCDRTGQVVEVVKPGDGVYGYWVSRVRQYDTATKSEVA